MVCIGGSIGKHAVNDRDVTCNQQINAITPYLQDISKFIFFTMGDTFFQKKIIKNAGGSATPIINKSKWSSIPIPLAPLAEQKRIVEKVDRLMKMCDQLESSIEQRTDKQTQLLNAVMANI
ncbi:MAG: hypothetical protein HC796_05375 [Synechococcaceae cyanobacterium RL_1_2]|nr:hypothetical protein [Synechococcaceae cyanobacterium RL_1_2]